MKLFLRTGISSALLSGIAVVGGCAASGHKGVEATSTRLTEMRTNVEALKSHVKASASSLAEVVEKADADPAPAFDKFSKNAKAVESAYNSAQSRANGVRAEADKLFKSWAENAKSITEPDLQKLSEERRASLSETLEKLMKGTQETLEETKSFVATTTDLRKYLSQDLTPAGIKGIEGKSKSQAKAASSIEEKLDEVMEAAQKAAAEFATAKPPATTK